MATEIKRVPGPAKKQLEILIKGLGDLEGRVGWFESARYPDGTPIAYVAAIQEFGSPRNNIPPRSFMRTTAAAQRKNWSMLMAFNSKAIIAGTMTPHQALDLLGQQARGDVQKKITQIVSPPLAPATIAARMRRKSNRKRLGSLDKPLIDTGQMLQTITSTVEEG